MTLTPLPTMPTNNVYIVVVHLLKDGETDGCGYKSRQKAVWPLR